MRTVKVTCDYCTRNITRAEHGANYVITLGSYARPGMHMMMPVYLPVDGPMHFCDMICLRNWISKGRRQKHARDMMSTPLDQIKTDEDGNIVIAGLFTDATGKRVQGKDTLSGDLEHVIAIGDLEVKDPDGKYECISDGNVHTFKLGGRWRRRR